MNEAEPVDTGLAAVVSIHEWSAMMIAMQARRSATAIGGLLILFELQD